LTGVEKGSVWALKATEELGLPADKGKAIMVCSTTVWFGLCSLVILVMLEILWDWPGGHSARSSCHWQTSDDAIRNGGCRAANP
jgi:hypothetical protein